LVFWGQTGQKDNNPEDDGRYPSASEGRIIINNMDISEFPEEVKGKTGFIPDRPFIYEKLTGIEFLRFIGGLYGLKRLWILKRGLRDSLRPLSSATGVMSWLRAIRMA
jgi:hypothetical protein